MFYTHYLGDHVGLMRYIDPDIPQYIGKGAKEVMVYKYHALGDKVKQRVSENIHTYSVAKKINIANRIYVTPLLVSHSAFDAYMFKMEADGKTILHTGDFRKHGYIGKKLEEMLTKYVGRTDILITHQPPRGICDIADYGTGPTHHGGIEFANRLKTLNLKCHLFGHEHDATDLQVINGTIYSNAAVLDDKYNIDAEGYLIEI